MMSQKGKNQSNSGGAKAVPLTFCARRTALVTIPTVTKYLASCGLRKTEFILADGFRGKVRAWLC